MATDTSATAANLFVQRRLPFMAGAVGALLYLLTFSHWITFLSLPTVAGVSGWLWQPNINRPLSLLILSPFRLLPEAWIPFALNVFNLLCAAAVLMLLARSVAILRHDMLPDRAAHKKPGADLLTIPGAWFPPLLAALVCGFQLSFWEHATSASGDMIGLLAFAYSFRCILEFRLNPKQHWLSLCAVIYAAGMTESWVMLGFFPVMLGAIIWVKGYGEFIHPRFLLRMALWGLVGLSLYLLPPLIAHMASSDVEFWAALKTHLRTQKQALAILKAGPYRLLVLASFLPFIVLAVRWKSHTILRSDDSSLGVFITRAAGHFIHGFYLGAALWITLNPSFSPRAMRLGDPGLIYYYIWSLVVGYGAGYFLLFTRNPTGKALRRFPLVAVLLLFAWPVLLAWRNLPEIRLTNGSEVGTFAGELYEDLPKGPSVVLSEDPRRLFLLRGQLASTHHLKNPVLVDTTLLTSRGYHAFLQRQYGSRWPQIPALDSAIPISPKDLLRAIQDLAGREPVVYLHPSSGHYFEPFVDEPKGLVHFLRPCPTNANLSEMLSEQAFTANESLWQQRWTRHLVTLAGTSRHDTHRPAKARIPLDWLRLEKEQNTTAAILCTIYSKSLDAWGVKLQQHGRWPEAGVWFQRALQLNPDNLAAAINLAYNERHRSGDPSRIEAAWVKEHFSNEAENFESWWEVIGICGPVDEPTCLLRTGRILLGGGYLQQATRAFSRSHELAPVWPAPMLYLSECLCRSGDFREALKWTDEIESKSESVNGPGLAQLLECRTSALLGLRQTNDVMNCLEDFVSRYGNHVEVLSASARIHVRLAQFSEGLELIDAMIEREPGKAGLFRRKALLEMQLNHFQEAAATLTQAISLAATDEDLRRLRAAAYLGAGRIADAREEYLWLLKRPGKQLAALYALGEISWRSRDTNAAIDYFQRYLADGIPDSAAYRYASRRLAQLSGNEPSDR